MLFRPSFLSLSALKPDQNLFSLFIAGLVSCNISELNQLLGRVGLMSIKTGMKGSWEVLVGRKETEGMRHPGFGCDEMLDESSCLVNLQH